jgi:hypothetical protein
MHAMMLATILYAQADKPTFCQEWNKGTPAEKIQFLLGPEDKMLASLKDKGIPDGNIATFKVCFEKNIVRLKDTLDKDCRVEDALTKFFGQQVDTSSQEYDHMTDYINLCTTSEGQST